MHLNCKWSWKFQWKLKLEKIAYNIAREARAKNSQKDYNGAAYEFDISHKWDHIIIASIMIFSSNECWHCYNHLHKQFFWDIPMKKSCDRRLKWNEWEKGTQMTENANVDGIRYSLIIDKQSNVDYIQSCTRVCHLVYLKNSARIYFVTKYL